MANFPTPPSLPQLIGQMAGIFQSRFGAKKIRPGSPVLAIIEATALAVVRSTQDIFQILAALDIDQATGVALQRAGAKEGLAQWGELAATGQITISDTSFTKQVGRIWHSQPAPIAGSTTFYVTGADKFPSSGNLYLGRSTTNYEGPLAYTITPYQTGVWAVTLSSPTQKYHPVGETVILAQGGNRLVSAGALVSTPTTSVAQATSFATTQTVTLLDGEDKVTNVPVVCQTPGVDGNVAVGAISYVPSPAFTGMAVTNERPFSNGRAAEDDDSFRSRIKKARQSKQLGTAVAIENAALGVTATDESATVLSTSWVRSASGPATLYVDDGSGYEEKTAGVALETILDLANGGEKTLSLALGHPVAKAFVTSLAAAPFSLVEGSSLAVNVGGVWSEHTFSASEFQDIAAATAYEVVAAINADPNILFAARTCSGGRQVTLFAKSEENDDLQVTTASGLDANDVLVFPTTRAYTLRLFRNDSLLTKDGYQASVYTQPQSAWVGLTSGDTLTITVDGTTAQTYSFQNSDFVKLGYSTVSELIPLSTWAAVLNAKIPGVSAAVSGQRLVLTSNRGRSSQASIAIDPDSTLVAKGMFDPDALTAQGRSQDYVIDRNTGLIEFTSPLSTGDRITAGSVYTRAYLSAKPVTVPVTVSGANLYFAVDGDAQILPTGLGGSYTLATTTVNTIKRYTAKDANNKDTALFSNLQAGDFLVSWQSGLTNKVTRIVNVDVHGTWFEVDDNSATPAATITGLDYLAWTFVRTTGRIQAVTLSGTYTLDTLAAALQVTGATASVYRSQEVRVSTNSYENGSIGLVAQNAAATALGFTVGVVANVAPSVAAVESANAEGDVPAFQFSNVQDFSGNALDTVLARATLQTGANQWMARFGRPLGAINRWDALSGLLAPATSGTMDFTTTLDAQPIKDNGSTYHGSRVSLACTYGLGAQDQIVTVLDNDPSNKMFTVDLFRKIVPAAATYGGSMSFTDSLTGKTLKQIFGSSFDFTNFAVMMHPRVITHPGTDHAILWRLGVYGPTCAGISYVVPTAASSTLAVQASTTKSSRYDISVSLPTGAARAIQTLAPSVNWNWKNVTSGAATNVTMAVGFNIASIARTSNVTTVTVTLPGDITDHGFQTGQSVTLVSTDANFVSGTYTITRDSATQFHYADTGSNASLASPTTVFVTKNLAVNPKFSATVQVGDYFTGTNTNANFNGAAKVLAVGDGWVKLATYQPTLTGTGAWDWTFSALSFYPLTATTTANVVQAANATTFVSAVAIGSGNVTQGTTQDYIADTTSPNPYLFADGINYVESSTLGVDYSFTFKNAVTASLNTSQWLSEDVRLVPATAKNIADFLNADAVSGLKAYGASVQTSAQAHKIQIATPTVGSTGAIQITGGSGNSVVSLIKTVAEQIQNGTHLKVPLADLNKFVPSSLVIVRNTKPDPKAVQVSGALTLSGNKISIPGGRAWAGSTTGPLAGGRWYIEKHGPYACWVSADGASPATNFSGTENDWVVISPSIGNWTNVDNTSTIAGRMVVKLQDGRVVAMGGTDSADGAVDSTK